MEDLGPLPEIRLAHPLLPEAGRCEPFYIGHLKFRLDQHLAIPSPRRQAKAAAYLHALRQLVEVHCLEPSELHEMVYSLEKGGPVERLGLSHTPEFVRDDLLQHCLTEGRHSGCGGCQLAQVRKLDRRGADCCGLGLSTGPAWFGKLGRVARGRILDAGRASLVEGRNLVCGLRRRSATPGSSPARGTHHIPGSGVGGAASTSNARAIFAVFRQAAWETL